MIKSAVLALSLGFASVMGVMQASANAYDTGFNVTPSQSVVLEKKLTKAECLKKDGYIWDSSKKKCVKDTRGSEETRGSN